MKKNKKITLNSLALMIGKGFNDMGKRFGRVDQRFDRIDKNFEEVTSQINKINLNIVDVVRQDEFNKLEQRVTNLEEN